MQTIRETFDFDEETCLIVGFDCDDGTFELRYFPSENATYDNLLQDKLFLAKKMIEKLNQIYLFCEGGFDENEWIRCI